MSTILSNCGKQPPFSSQCPAHGRSPVSRSPVSSRVEGGIFSEKASPRFVLIKDLKNAAQLSVVVDGDVVAFWVALGVGTRNKQGPLLPARSQSTFETDLVCEAEKDEENRSPRN